MPRSRRSNSSSDEEQSQSRKLPRRSVKKAVSYADHDHDEDGNEDFARGDAASVEAEDLISYSSEDEDDAFDYEQEEEMNNRRSTRLKNSSKSKTDKVSLRVSSRSNKSTAYMADDYDSDADVEESISKEPAANARASKRLRQPAKEKEEESSSEDDFLGNQKEDVEDYTVEIALPPAKKNNNKKKSANNVKTKRRQQQQQQPPKQQLVFEPFKIQKILAHRTETQSTWKIICQPMNTFAIQEGSRWIRDDIATEEMETEETRYLIKWKDLTYMHCTWETKQDLLEYIEGAKTSFTVFHKKCHEDGCVYSADERCDGEFFDPAWTQIERILEVHYPEGCLDDVTHNGQPQDYGVVLDQDGNADVKGEGFGRQFLIKWKNLSYSQSTYEFERDLLLLDISYEDQVKEFHERSTKIPTSVAKEREEQGKKELQRLYRDVFGQESDSTAENGPRDYQRKLEEKEYPSGGKLRDYQAEGVAWLVFNYVNGRSSILADEMGLGKTIQVAAFLDVLNSTMQRRGPFLVVVPLTTLCNWKRELDKWLGLNTIVYHGGAKDLVIARQSEIPFEEDIPSYTRVNELFLRKCAKAHPKGMGNPWMVEVVLTTPGMLTKDDYTELTAVDWECLVIDEAQQIKNHKSKFALNLRDHMFTFKHKILLTGTPIQNNMKELFALLNFVDPLTFPDCEVFLEKYGEMKSKELLDSLHKEIGPTILRRLKEDVEKSVPPKEETVIEVELTVAQKQYYRALYEKNAKFLLKNKRKAVQGPSLSNISIQLRKCCNHLFLLNGIEDDFRAKQHKEGATLSEGDILVKASGKLVLLDKLLPRLKGNGHRVLLFSQFKIMLDVLEDYLQARAVKFERIDGSITGKKRQQAIDRFQAPSVEGNEQPFIMLLSTRAGGVGINLTAADTCIIFDSDFNPQNDLQAQARCHRIGQTKDVKVYRLLSRQTYEMHMFRISSMKMGLDQAVLSGFESGAASGDGTLTKDDIEKLLREGAYAMLEEDEQGAEASSKAFAADDIDTILERRTRTVVHDNSGTGSAAAGGHFSKASFATSSSLDGKQANSKEKVPINDPNFWEKMLGHVVDNHDAEEVMVGKRARTNVKSYSEDAYDQTLRAKLRLSGEGVDPDESNADSEVDDDSFEQGEESESDSDSEIDVLSGKAQVTVAVPTAAGMPAEAEEEESRSSQPNIPLKPECE